jgi:CHAT domain-containing protein
MNGPQAAAPEQIFAQLPDHDIVHLTCHGFFDDRDPLQSGLILGDGRQRPPREQHGMSVRQRRPYLITAEELLTLRLKAELVTLRACSTALVGERNAGDEFDGLTRSFIHAGARAVLAGQWNVDQQSSQALLSAFYENWLRPATRQRQRLQKWQALRLAQLEFLNSTAEPYLAHPYHWAPLALLGDWR